jgi:hypothetical protein
MNTTDYEPEGARAPLVRCPICDERLQLASELAADGAVLDRVCPGCDYRDSVVAPSLSVAMWQRGETQALADLRPLVALLVEQEIG